MPTRPKRLRQRRYEPNRYADPLHPEWLEGPVPKHFWEDHVNHLRYIHWLGRLLGFQKHEDWYRISRKDFSDNGGNMLVHYYDGICDVVMKLFPNHDWKVWLFKPMPQGFWEEPKNRVLYMRWLGKKLGFKKTEDWYKITYQALVDNGGTRLATAYWNCSAITGVKECFPDYPWLDWKFHQVSSGFWQKDSNCRRYMKWLSLELGIQRPEDWYHVTYEDFGPLSGQGFLVCREMSVPQAVMRFGPRHDFKEWLFDRSPPNLWEKRSVRRKYMRWLAKRLKFTTPNDWYDMSVEEVCKNHGRGMTVYYHRSVVAMVKDHYPKRKWLEWKFNRVPNGFWENRKNRHHFFDWLGKQLGYRKPEDWLKLRREDFRTHCGSLQIGFGSYVELFEDYLPAKIMKQLEARVKKTDFTVELILHWADQHHQRTGKWPKKSSGKIRNQKIMWASVCEALQEGTRGLSGKRTLTQLLKTRK